MKHLVVTSVLTVVALGAAASPAYPQSQRVPGSARLAVQQVKVEALLLRGRVRASTMQHLRGGLQSATSGVPGSASAVNANTSPVFLGPVTGRLRLVSIVDGPQVSIAGRLGGPSGAVNANASPAFLGPVTGHLQLISIVDGPQVSVAGRGSR